MQRRKGDAIAQKKRGRGSSIKLLKWKIRWVELFKWRAIIPVHSPPGERASSYIN